MTKNESRFWEALTQIADVADNAVGRKDQNGHHHGHNHYHENNAGDAALTCAPKSLPERLLVTAAETARAINPVNAPPLSQMAMFASDLVLDPQRIAVLTSKYWGPSARRLTVSFMESTPATLRQRIVLHMNAWTRTSSVSFVETQGVGQVRISRAGSGYWSYLGTDILHIPGNRPTMNLQGFSMSTPESEYKRIVRHETGHTLGFPHEHMRQALVARIDPQKAYEYFQRTQGWDRATVNAQVLTPLDERSLMSTPPDQTSIMCYQLPGSITRDGRPILGGVDINPTDFGFAGRIYPRTGNAPAQDADSASDAMAGQDHSYIHADDWDPSEDVAADQVLAAA